MRRMTVVAIFVAIFVAGSSVTEAQTLLQKLRSKFTPQKKAEPVSAAAKKVAPPVKAEAPAAPSPAAEGPKALKKSAKDMTREELLNEITGMIAQEKEIIAYMPDLKLEKTPDGSEYYTFRGDRLEGLDRQTLAGLLSRAQNNAVRIRAERITKQMDTIRRAQDMANNPPAIPAIPKPPPMPAIPSSINSMPQPPKVPPVPPSAKQPPKAPPAAPSQPKR